MGKKYIIEMEDKPFHKEDGDFLYRVKGFNSLVFDMTGISKLKPYAEPDLERIRLEAEQLGMVLAWEAARKIELGTNDGGLSIDTMTEIFGTLIPNKVLRDFTASEAIEKLKAYEQEQGIKAGDEVFCVDCPDIKIWVIDVHDNKFAGIALSDVNGCCDIGDLFKEEPLKNYAKTGNHYDITTILENMRGEQDG